uniref:Uncharacterized protein n=1 Tax=Heterorhabditis bacteriophora TaxID=37862 RepID=A0A1I7X8X8_HETBA
MGQFASSESRQHWHRLNNLCISLLARQHKKNFLWKIITESEGKYFDD